MSIRQKIKSGASGGRQSLCQALAGTLRGETLTFGGELLITKKGMHNVSVEEIAALGLQETLTGLRETYPQLTIKTVSGLCDVTIKLFLYRSGGKGPQFYELLQTVFSHAAKQLYLHDDYCLRLNVTGEFQSLGKIEQFRYMNKDEVVLHKVTGTTLHRSFLKSWRQKMAGKLDPLSKA